jgi:hypothetical protein
MEELQPRGTERLVLAIGEISATHRMVLTPSGRAPVNAVRWTIREDAPPRVLAWRRAVAGSGTPEPGGGLTVTVSGPGWQHVERLGPATREDAAAIRAKVTQARMLALRAVVWSPLRSVQLVPAEAERKVVEPAR